MWQVADPEKWARAHAGSHTSTCRVELWSGSKMLSESAPVIDGAVTDDWVIAGVRRSLTMTVPPTPAWLRWLTQDSLEVRPYLGVRYSRILTDECPMGRYPLTQPERTMPAGPIPISVNDYSDWIEGADFVDTPVPRPAGKITDAIRWLVRGAGLPDPVNISTATERSGKVLLDQTRMDAVAEAAKSVAVDVYMDRRGVPTIADSLTLDDPTSEILVGDGGTAVGVAVKPDPSKVYNVISVKSSATGVDFPAQVARITWEGHPAHPYRLGSRARPRERVFHYSSPLVTTPAQAMRAAQSILARKSAPARTTVYQSFPDPSRDAGDSAWGSTMTGSEVVQIDQVVHPFRPAPSTITTVSTQLVSGNVLYIFGDAMGA